MKDKTTFIWNITNDCLRNIYKPHEYVPQRPSQDILAEIIASEERMMATLKELLGNE